MTNATELLEHDVIRGLTVWEPWGSALACGAKRCETRSWPAPDWMIGGTILVHAAKRIPVQADVDLLFDLMRQAGKQPSWDISDSLGCVVAIARLKSCKTTRECRPSKIERKFGDYSVGRFAWKLSPIWPLNMPVPTRGAQKLWTVSDELKRRVLDAVV